MRYKRTRISGSHGTLGGSCEYLPGLLTVKGSMHRNQLAVFRKALDDLLREPGPLVQIDFAGCRYLSSLFIGALVDGILRAKESGKRVEVIVSPEVGQFFGTAHLYELFEYREAGAKIGSGIGSAATP